MDIAIHWGILRHLRDELRANAAVLMTAIALDLLVLFALLWFKLQSDPFIVWCSAIGLVAIFAGEWGYLRGYRRVSDGR